MKATILSLLIPWWCVCVAAQDQTANSIRGSLPTEEELGPGWQRPEGFGRLHGEPDAELSDQDYVLFTAGTDGGAKSYAVIVDRYRDEGESQKAFAALTKTGSEEFEDTTLQGIGDAALFVRHVNGFAANGEPTLWFRRGRFRISISPASRTSGWENDAALQHLAKVLDQWAAAAPAKHDGPAH